MALTALVSAIAVVLSVHSAVVLPANWLAAERPLVFVSLTVVFFLAEQYLITIEFRRESHSMTFAGVPLALGVLLLPTHGLVIARLVGSVAAFAIQRPSVEKAAYNAGAYAFEAALVSTIVHSVLGATVPIDLRSAVVVIVTLAAADQLMSLLVLVVIRWHSGHVSRADAIEVLTESSILSVVTTVIGVTAAVVLRRGLLGDVLVALLVGFAILVYRVYAATTRRHQALAVVHDFVVNSVRAPSSDSLGHHALTRIRQMLRAGTAELLIKPFDPSRQDGPSSYTRIAVDEDGDLQLSPHFDGDTDWVLVKAVEHGEPTVLSHTSKDPAIRRWLDAREVSEAMVAPLFAGDDLLGALVVKERLGESLTFTEDDLTLLQTLAGHLGVSLRSTHVLEKLSYEATHDSLTGLANRSYLTAQLRELGESATGEAALLLFDLNKFKEVNEVLGHDVGDRLLVVVAQRLRDGLPEGCVVARLGGDEFAALVPGLGADAAAAAEGLAVTARDRIAEPVRFTEARLVPESSVGVAVTSIVPYSHLLRCADTALHEAKGNDRGVAIYDVDMDHGRAERLALLADLRLAMAEHPEQFVAYYQPKFDLRDRTIIGAEALVRWNHPDRGTIPPDQFIPLAETSGLIEKLTSHVLLLALEECRRWLDAGHDLTIAVNVSARSIKDPGLPERVEQLLARTGVPADRLILEITEGSVMEERERAVANLHALVERGICLSLDDFGTGYSSLSYLQQLPVNELKIDRSFVARLNGAAGAGPERALVRSIAALGRSLGLRVVAEGIETEQQLAELLELGCHVGQGYLISRPVPTAAMRDLLSGGSLPVLPFARSWSG